MKKKEVAVQITVELAQPDILAAMNARGWNLDTTAAYLGISPTTLLHFIHYYRIPQEFGVKLTTQLFNLTGKTPDRLFPEEIRTRKNGRSYVLFTELEPQEQRQVEAALSDYSDTEEIAAQDELRKILQTMIGCLDNKQRQVMRLLFDDDLTVREAAEVMDCTPKTVRRYRDLALHTLYARSSSSGLAAFAR